ncbi:MAG: alkaline phosphatase family protein [Chitinophagaceae bacterium]|nr:alkaline phosphatase family protein [Chitinophagaceae bacterium]
MIKKFLVLFCCHLLLANVFSQKNIPRPKLVIGLVIDQMRWDYLYRYYDLYSANGFKRLLGQGFSCENTMVPYVPTYTAPGHTCIYTGSIPAIHGIVGNNWYEKSIGKNVYCTDDSTVKTVGSNTDLGKMSPRNLWVSTIGDELKLSNNFKSKVIGIALKDRASILPAGHTGSAYWFDEIAGKWISSSYYLNGLPGWLVKLNEKKYPDQVMLKDWNTLLPGDKYGQSTADDKKYENTIPGERTVMFPHRLSQITSNKYEAFKYTPFANTYTFEMAKAAIENEKLGTNSVPDMLAISVSSTDYIGHRFGPNSVEIEDTYLRLDNDISDFLNFLDSKEGKGNYLLFLSADHGVAHIPAFLKENKMPGGFFNESDLAKEINTHIERVFSIKNAVLLVENYQVYLNMEEMNKNEKYYPAIKESIIQYLIKKWYIVNAFETEKIMNATIPEPEKKMMINGYNPKRSGEIEFVLKTDFFDLN